MTKQQQIDTLQQKLDAANKQIAETDNALKEQYHSIATGIISQIESWFKDQSENCTIFVNYDDVYKYLDSLRAVIEATSPKYTPSILCELSMALSEARRQLAEQRIQHEVDKRALKERLNRVYGVKSIAKASKIHATQYAQAVVDYALQQENGNEN